MASIAAIDVIIDQTHAALRALDGAIGKCAAKWVAALDAANERYEYDREIGAAWAAYEAHENNGHVQPHELAWADVNSDWLQGYEEGEDHE